MELPIGAIARVAIAGAPYRQRGTAVTAKKSKAAWGADRSKHPIARSRQGMEQPMAIQYGVAKPIARKDLVESFVVGALGQPNALGA